MTTLHRLCCKPNDRPRNTDRLKPSLSLSLSLHHTTVRRTPGFKTICLRPQTAALVTVVPVAVAVVEEVAVAVAGVGAVTGAEAAAVMGVVLVPGVMVAAAVAAAAAAAMGGVSMATA